MSSGPGSAAGSRGGGDGGKHTLVEVALVEVVGAGYVHVVETGDIAVAWPESVEEEEEEVVVVVAPASEMLQQLDLSQGTFGEDLLAEDIGDLFDGYALARLVVGGCAAGRMVSVWWAWICSSRHTRRCHRHPAPAPWSHYTARQR